MMNTVCLFLFQLRFRLLRHFAVAALAPSLPSGVTPFWLLFWPLFLLCFQPQAAIVFEEGAYHVFPGDPIQEAVDRAAKNPTNKLVKVHAGQYRPTSKRQALIWFNRSHDGIRLEAVGSVNLSAANPDITNPRAEGYPAVVNHVVYFGDGISSNTLLKGFRLTGANHFVTDKLTRQIEPDTNITKNLYFYTDGGAIKIFGRSYPRLENLEVVDNYASPCAGGISVQHIGFNQDWVSIENCVFVRNRAQVTGAAVDLLEGSAARLINCLFAGNASNMGEDIVARRSGEPPFTNSGVVTIFQHSRAILQNCTFTGNRNAIDDLGGESKYLHCIFADNTLKEGLAGPMRYELDLPQGAKVSGCIIRGVIIDPRRCVSANDNLLKPPAPQFDTNFVPTAIEYRSAGYSPVRPTKADQQVGGAL